MAENVKAKPSCQYGESCYRKNLHHFYSESHPLSNLKSKFFMGITGVYENIMLDSVFKIHGTLPSHAYIFTYQAETEFLKKIFRSFNRKFDIDLVVDRKVNDVSDLETIENLKVHVAKSGAYSSHHPKLFVFDCGEFWYFAVSTANLVWFHWGDRVGVYRKYFRK